MNRPAPVALLFDVDNTLLDNDGFERELRHWLDQELGAGSADRYWRAFEARRQQCGYADFIGAVQQCFIASGRDSRWLRAGDRLLDHPFERHLFPGALAVLEMAREIGPTWLISDGDGVMQPRKLRRAGLWDAVGGHVRIYEHKERRLADIEGACPAAHYVFVDDKARILDAVKAAWGRRVTTVQPLQGHYALDLSAAENGRPADCAIDSISTLLQADWHISPRRTSMIERQKP